MTGTDLWTMAVIVALAVITLVLAGVLAGLGEKARRSGCTVKCTGLRQPSAKCEAVCEAASFPAGCAGRKGWWAIAGEPSYLHG